MKHLRFISFLLILLLTVASCSNAPKMFWSIDEDEVDGNQPMSSKTGKRAPLDVPPELRGEVQVPMPEGIAVDAGR